MAVAHHDNLKAYALIDHAFDILLYNKQSDPFEEDNSRAERGALLAVQAVNIGYPERNSLVYRALACRQVFKVDAIVHNHNKNLINAMILAFIDPEIARKALEGMKPYADSMQFIECEIYTGPQKLDH